MMRRARELADVTDDWDDDLDSEPPLDPTGEIDLSEVRLNLDADRRVRDRHILVRMSGSFAGKVHGLGPRPERIGRAPDAELRVDEPGVSRRHARLEPAGEGYELVDLGSANGTYVYGERITRHRLVDGELVRFGGSAVFRYTVTDREHEQMLAGLYDASVHDPLTGIYNREHFDERLRSELAFAARHGTELSLVIFDIDHFKRVNDRYGHPAGDDVLRQVARLVDESVRAEDLVARYGGEEFAVLLRNIDVGGAAVLSERLRRLVAATVVEHGPHRIQVTASFGCASLSGCGVRTGQALVTAADRRLYEAKRAGRDRVVAG